MSDRVKGVVRYGWLVTFLWCACIVLLGASPGHEVQAPQVPEAIVVSDETLLPLSVVIALCAAAIAATYKAAMTLARIDSRLSQLERGQDANHGNAGPDSGGDEGAGDLEE